MGQISAFSRPALPAFGTANWPSDPPGSLFLFRLVGGRQFALSLDAAGRNIPVGFRDRAWRFVRRIQFLPDEVRQDFDPRVVAAAIARDGYALIGCPFYD